MIAVLLVIAIVIVLKAEEIVLFCLQSKDKTQSKFGKIALKYADPHCKSELYKSLNGDLDTLSPTCLSQVIKVDLL